ncbi:hypothetical protein MNV_90003 [Candidatus Methanoperedens nitroreducens]|uniref:Uncharacterized protein n=1 Tax=Candidatus Methanoperedens nitratireducens TaxID=1392998 RepID=A0A284VU99_9EURY|nr:hypothetical protein MNV_90003 [Candidatus Methanoperedens nitroreducens]
MLNEIRMVGNEWKKFTRSMQAKAGESPCICGIGAGNSMLFSSSMSRIFYRTQVSHEVAVAEKEYENV